MSQHIVEDGMRRDINGWISAIGPASLSRLGIRKGDNVLDFGSGPGYYALAAAQVVGPTGRVIAVEKNPMTAFRARRRLSATDIAEVRLLDTRDSPQLPLADDCIDLALAFDVLLPCYFSDQQISDAIREIFRVMKPDGLLAVYPSHVRIEGLLPFINGAGFATEASLVLPLLHFGRLMEDTVFKFRKDLS